MEFSRLFVVVFLVFHKSVHCSIKPHIVFILADDLGWNDVGFHGSGQIPTPNIDALAYSGLILNNYYVTPICTPSRSALFTGKYPIHLGTQHSVLYGTEARGLPLNEKLLPEYLKDLGYATRIVGKWHLGSFRKIYTPTFRGFDSHLGYWTGHQDLYDHTAVENPGWGFDMRRNLEPAHDLHGQYSTDIFTREACKIIQEHNQSKPLFLYLAHAAVHSGNPYEPLRAPDDVIDQFSSKIRDFQRRKFAGVLTKLDESVGKVVESLAKHNLLQNSIVIFSTDNGGPAAGFNLNAASNFPLKGVKNTLWEGGVRGAGLIWSPLIKQAKRVARQRMHISDWLPTLLSMVGDQSELSGNLDGFDLFQALSEDVESPRNEILHNIDDIWGSAAVTAGKWKLVKGTNYNGTWDDWYGPSGRNDTYDIDGVINSKSGQALKSINIRITKAEIESLRRQAEVNCGKIARNPCNALKETCLFDIEEDPCEYNNVASSNVDVVAKLEGILEQYNSTAIPPMNLPLDPRGNPKYWNNEFTNFGDFVDL